MPIDSVFKNKRIAVAGFGTEGRSAAYFLAKSGARVEVFDDKPESEFLPAAIGDLRQLGVIFYFGSMGPFNGFDIVVRSPGIAPHAPALTAAQKQGIAVTSATKIFFDLCPGAIIGVTGTKGKGTTSSLIHQALLAAGKDAYLCGNIGTPALDFLDKLKPESVVVYELSSFQLLEIDRGPQIAVVLMITSEHLDFHATTEEYVAAKTNIVRFQKKTDKAVINIDYPASRNIAAQAKAEVFLVSRSERSANGSYVAEGSVWISENGQARKIIAADEVPLPGAHNLENVCAAAMAASLTGVSDVMIAQAVKAFKSLPHRLELAREAGGVKYYDDSFSTTPDSAIVALRAFAAPKILILGGSSKGADWAEFAVIAAADISLKAIIGIGAEWPKIKAALAAAGGRDIPVIEGLRTMPEIVQAAAQAAAAGEVVILSPACASFDMFKNYKDRGEQFAAAVRALP